MTRGHPCTRVHSPHRLRSRAVARENTEWGAGNSAFTAVRTGHTVTGAVICHHRGVLHNNTVSLCLPTLYEFLSKYYYSYFSDAMFANISASSIVFVIVE